MPDGQRWWLERVRAWASAQEVSTPSQRTYREHLARWPDSVAAIGFDAPTSASAVTREMIRAFKERGVRVRGRRSGQVLAPSSRAMDLSLLRSFLAFESSKLALDLRLFRGPSSDPINVRWLESPADVDGLISASAEDPDLQAAIVLMAHCGLRSAEFRALVVRDLLLSLTRGSWVVVQNGKGGKARRVPVPSAARNVILAAISGKNPPARVYPWGRSKLGRDLASAALRAGIGPLSPHDLRRSYARFQRRANVKLEALQQQMGHRRPEVTLRYVGRDPDAMQEAADAYDRYLAAVGVRA